MFMLLVTLHPCVRLLTFSGQLCHLLTTSPHEAHSHQTKLDRASRQFFFPQETALFQLPIHGRSSL
jgi:hypothetical protein